MNMDHERCSELLLPYVQGELDPETSGGVEEHLAACVDCRKESEGLAALFSEPIESLNDLERAALHRDLRQRVSIPAGPPQEKAGLSWLPQALGVAALLLVVVIGFQYLGGTGSEDEAASSGGGSSTEDKANLAAPEGPEPVTLKLTSSGVRQAGAIAAGEGATAGFESSQEEDASDAPPESAEPEQPDALERQNDDSTGKLTTNTRASVESALKTYARTSPTFTRFAATYRAEDVDDLTPTFIEDLAEDAPESSAGQVTECAQLVVTSREFPTLPAAAAHGVFRKEDSLLLGFVWTEQTTGPLDNYVIYVWPIGSCSTPSHSQSGRIRTGG